MQRCTPGTQAPLAVVWEIAKYAVVSRIDNG
jgi:hypothetical protein